MVFRGECVEFAASLHRAIVVDDLGDHGSRCESRHACEIDRGLCVRRPLQHPAFAVAQGEDVAGPGEIRGTRGTIDQRPHRGGPVGGRDARCRARTGVDRDCERGALHLGVLLAGDHQRQLEGVEPFALHRQTDEPARVADHERHLFGRHLLRRDDEIAFRLGVVVVDHDQELTAPHRVDGELGVAFGHRALQSASSSSRASSPTCVTAASRKRDAAASVRGPGNAKAGRASVPSSVGATYATTRCA